MYFTVRHVTDPHDDHNHCDHLHDHHTLPDDHHHECDHLDTNNYPNIFVKNMIQIFEYPNIGHTLDENYLENVRTQTETRTISKPSSL